MKVNRRGLPGHVMGTKSATLDSPTTGSMGGMTTPTLRTASREDRDRLVAFWAEAGENDARPTDRPDLVGRLLAHDPDSVIIAEIDQELVGTVVAGWDGWRANLYRLAVAPTHRRKGLARLLLGAAEDRFVSLGAERAAAMVLVHNTAGRGLWQAHDYTEQGDWSRWVKPLGR